MWPRLQLLRELLAESGIILISIDDNEQARLKIIMDEIFGENNFMAELVWEGTGKNDSKFFSVSHDYILCYAKNKNHLRELKTKWRLNKLGIDNVYKQVEKLKKKHKSDFKKISAELKTWYSNVQRTEPEWANRHYNKVDEKGVFFSGDISSPGGGPHYEILHPKTKKPVKTPSRGWRFASKKKMLEMIAEQKIYFGDDETRVPTLKRYLHETEGQVLTSVLYKDRRAAKKELQEILKGSDFPNPKDVSVIKTLLRLITESDDIILDSFAGSGITAHAVLSLNKEDNGHRKFILIEREKYANKITAERMRRVIKGMPKSKKPELKSGTGGSFSYYTLGKPIDREKMLTGEILPDYSDLASHLLYISNVIITNTKLRPGKDGLFYSHENIDYYLLYKPNVKYMQSNAAVLSEGMSQRIHRKGRDAIIFAASKNMSQSELKKMNIQFCRIPDYINKRM